ncbi:MAG: GNAT family N-acetyltransferase [Vicinamibacterales bacterium]
MTTSATPPPLVLQPVTLTGQHATLIPLAREHAEPLEAAARDGELWRLWYTTVPHPEQMAREIDRRLGLLHAGSMLPFTVLDGAGTPVGMTTYMNVDAVNRRVEIGSTWYASRVQRTGLKHDLQAAPAPTRVRRARVHRRRVPHAPAQYTEPACDRAARREARWHPPQSHADAERHASRHGCLQHHPRRVADGAGASELAAGTRALIRTHTQGLRESGIRARAFIV